MEGGRRIEGTSVGTHCHTYISQCTLGFFFQKKRTRSEFWEQWSLRCVPQTDDAQAFPSALHTAITFIACSPGPAKSLCPCFHTHGGSVIHVFGTLLGSSPMKL